MPRTISPEEQAAYEGAEARRQAAIDKASKKYERQCAKAQKMIDDAQAEYDSAKEAARERFRKEEGEIYDRFNPRVEG